VEAGAKRVGTGAERALGQSNLHRWKSPLRQRCGRGFEREDGEGAAEEEESGELRQTRRGRAPPPRLEKQLPQGHFLIHPARRLVVARATRLYSLPSSNPAAVYRPRSLVETQGREEKTNPRNENAAGSMQHGLLRPARSLGRGGGGGTTNCFPSRSPCCLSFYSSSTAPRRSAAAVFLCSTSRGD
jgi:hypothetical protein